MDASLDTLIAQLGASAPEERRLAVMGLDEADDPRAVAPLIAALRDPDATVRRLAVRALGDGDAGVRREAVVALGYLREPGTVPALRAALEDPDASVRRLVIGALNFFKDPALLPCFLTALSDPDWQVRREAAIVLGRS